MCVFYTSGKDLLVLTVRKRGVGDDRDAPNEAAVYLKTKERRNTRCLKLSWMARRASLKTENHNVFDIDNGRRGNA